MPIEKGFEALTPVLPDDVYSIFSDLETHIPLWSIYDSLQRISSNEAMVVVRISGTPYQLKVRLSTESRERAKTIVVEGKGQIYLHLRLIIEPKGIGSLVSGRIYVKAGFFKERILSPAIVDFIEDLKNKIMFELPSIAEVIRRRRETSKEKGVIRAPPSIEGEERPTEAPPPKVSEVVEAPKEKPSAELREVAKQVELLPIAENPSALSDELTLGMILLKGKLVAVEKFEGSWDLLIKLVSKHVGEGKNIYARLKSDVIDIKILVKDGRIVGIRVDDTTSNVSLNGAGALEKVRSLEKIAGRAYVFEVPEDALRTLT
jgi:hypothetical protein